MECYYSFLCVNLTKAYVRKAASVGACVSSFAAMKGGKYAQKTRSSKKTKDRRIILLERDLPRCTLVKISYHSS